MKKIFIVIITSILLIINFGCAKKKNKTIGKNITQIQERQGIPVQIKTIQKSEFKKYLKYVSSLHPNKEAFVNAQIVGNVESIKHKVGDYVRKNDVIITFAEDNNMAQYKQAKAGYDLARKVYQRMQNLYKIGGISKQQLDSSETQYLVNKANFESVKKMLKVTAPISGIITDINVTVSQNVDPKTRLFSISDYKKIKSKIWVSQDNIVKYKIGLPVLAKWNNQKLTGKIFRISKASNKNFGGFGVDILFDNKDKLNLSGITVTINVEIYSNDNAIKIPQNLIQNESDGKFVWLEKGGFAKKQKIEIGQNSDLFTEILSGLNVGDKLIVKGYKSVKNNCKLKVVK